MRITVNPDKGWFASLPAATAHFIMGKLVKANADPKSNIDIRFASEHWSERVNSGPLNQRAATLGANLARDFRDVPPWTGAGGKVR